MYLGASYKRLNRFSDSIWWFLSCSLLVCYHADCDIKPYWALVSLRITIIPFSSKNQNFKCRTRMLARGCSWMNSVSASGLHIKRIGPKKKLFVITSLKKFDCAKLLVWSYLLKRILLELLYASFSPIGKHIGINKLEEHW